jgi:AMP-polyphosphate phosphotransferase
MLNSLDRHQTLDKATYNQQMEDLMQQLRQLQHRCWKSQQSCIVVLEGWAASGKGSLVKKLVQYMDPRGFRVHPIWPATPEERSYPFLWRFWQKLPPKGHIAIFYHSWYTRVLEDRLFKRISAEDVPTTLRHVNAFERQLTDDGVAIAKFWLDLTRKELKQRLKTYGRDELLAWRVRPEDWQQVKRYDRYQALAEEMILHTSTGSAPWTLVEADCKRWARVKVLGAVVATLGEALDRQALAPPPCPVPSPPPSQRLEPMEPNWLAQVDLTQAMAKDDYRAQLKAMQTELRQLQQQLDRRKLPVVVLFEGWDAAGKGGAIKRLTDVLDPRSYQVHAFAAPTDEEKAQHYLWRFWRRLPAAGTIGIFDRSWYGRVLVERIEGFAQDAEWRRAYWEINEFESQLVTGGYVLVKFWLHISPEEQLHRFQERQQDPFKQHKLTPEDWRNREQWAAYGVAVNQMIQRTHTPLAPWTLIPADDKYYARVKVLQSVIQAIATALKFGVA